MKRRRVLIVVGGVAVIVLVALAFVVFLPESAINKTNYERIRHGMSLKEVEGIFGLPAGDYSGGVVVADNPENDLHLTLARIVKHRFHGTAVPSRPQAAQETTSEWVSDRAMVIVHFADDKVIDMDFFVVRRKSESIVAKVRRWLGR